jgi:hypothetical protein
LPLEQVFKKVIAGVDTATHGKQRPWSEASLQGDFYFHAAMSASVAARADLDPRELELTFWDSIKDSSNPADFEAYLRKYPHGEFAGIASNRVRVAAPLPRAAPQAVLTAPAVKKPTDLRCESILQRAQLGETLNEEDRVYIKERCQ